MKKTLLLIFILLCAITIFMTGCGGYNEHENDYDVPVDGQENDEDDKNGNGSANDDREKEVLKSYDFYPFFENTRLHYDGEGSEYVAERVHFDYMTDNRAQIRRETAGTTLLEMIEYREGKVYSLLQHEESYRRESFYEQNIIDENSQDVEVLIMDPIEVGTQWTVRDGVIREITNVNLTLETPAGTFNVIEVTSYEDDTIFTVYYSKDYGKVKTIFEAEETEVYAELVDVGKNYIITEQHRFFYPDFEQNRLVYVEKEVTLETNDAIEVIFEQYFQQAPHQDSAEYSPLMSENTKINDLRLNRENFIAHIDFSEEFISEMNAGSSLENMILTSVVRTVGEYFMVDKILITIGGEPYRSGHFEFEEGEALENIPSPNEEKIQ